MTDEKDRQEPNPKPSTAAWDLIVSLQEAARGPFAPTVLSQIMRERHAAGTCGWGCPECQAESK